MSLARAKELFDENTSVEGQMMSPAIWGIVLQILTTAATYCQNRGNSTAMIAQSLKTPNPNQKRNFRANLRRKLGSSKYKSLGGHEFADRSFAAGAAMKAKEAQAFVKEITS